MERKHYGMEIIMDLHDCDLVQLEKKSLKVYVKGLCELTGMQRVKRPKFWHERSFIPHLRGWSVVQFIKTSDIVVHTLSMTSSAYINFFSCKDFDNQTVVDYTKKHFKTDNVKFTQIFRV